MIRLTALALSTLALGACMAIPLQTAPVAQTAAALKALDQGIAQLENSVKTLSRKQNTAKGDITAGD